MNRLQIRKENELKDNRCFILAYLDSCELISEREFRSYATMIMKLYENGYYEEYAHILDEVEEEALIEIIELVIGIIDDGNGDKLTSAADVLIRNIETICVKKQYTELAKALLDLAERLE